MVSIDELMNLYEQTKREKCAYPLYYYNKIEEKIVSFRDASKASRLGVEKGFYCSEQEIEKQILSKGYIPFINSYDVFLRCLEQFLEKINDSSVKKQVKQVQDGKNYVGRILYALDHGCYYYSFIDYEEKQVVEILEKWCNKHNILFSPYTLELSESY